jgi:hypothetical protein
MISDEGEEQPCMCSKPNFMPFSYCQDVHDLNTFEVESSVIVLVSSTSRLIKNDNTGRRHHEY